MFVTGLPGARKSSGFVSEFLNKYGAIEFNNDIAKTVKSLEKYYANGLGANVVQNIVSEAQKQLLPELLEEGYNIVYPAIGKKVEKVKYELNKYKNAGYDLSLIEVSVSNPTSQNRALKRFIETGRFVDPIDYIEGIANTPDLVYNNLIKEIENGSSNFNFTRIEQINNEPKASTSDRNGERTWSEISGETTRDSTNGMDNGRVRGVFNEGKEDG